MARTAVGGPVTRPQPFLVLVVGGVKSIRHMSDDVTLLDGTASGLVAWRWRLPKGRRTRNTIVASKGLRGLAVHRHAQRHPRAGVGPGTNRPHSGALGRVLRVPRSAVAR
jgi:hypothetical protein